MPKYHESGTICKAQPGNCPFGDGEHFDTKADAIKAGEERLAKERGGSFGEPKPIIPPAQEIEGYMGSSGFKGGNFNPNLSNKEIAACIRDDIKRLKQAGEIPKDVDVRVTSDHLSVEMVATLPTDDPYMYSVKDNNLTYGQISRGVLKPEYQAVRDKLEQLHKSYNYSRSNSMVDYSDTGFYGRVSVQDRTSLAWDRERAAHLSYRREQSRFNKLSPDEKLAEIAKGKDSSLYKALHKHAQTMHEYKYAKKVQEIREDVSRNWANIGRTESPSYEDMHTSARYQPHTSIEAHRTYRDLYAHVADEHADRNWESIKKAVEETKGQKSITLASRNINDSTNTHFVEEATYPDIYS